MFANNIKNVVEKFDEIGWFGGMDNSEKVAIKEKLSKSESLYGFLNNLSVYSFDTECIDESGDYVSIIENLADCSAGKFKPTEVSDDIDFITTNTSTIKFTHFGKAYSITIPNQNDWFQPEVLDLVNRAIVESGNKEQFLTLPVQDQCAYLVFVDPDIYELANEIIDFEE
jgi:hypothetical protein